MIKKFEVTFIKEGSITVANPILRLAKQIFFSERDEIIIIPPKGYKLMQISEQLPNIHISDSEKIKINGRKKD